ncbi:MAG: hypothetical protein HWN81_08880 [Candidatus Lokiarchaeota archaeon]|nr:hypothetical protein [Candidatus Lokiarchaeota archaeon]
MGSSGKGLAVLALLIGLGGLGLGIYSTFILPPQISQQNEKEINVKEIGFDTEYSPMVYSLKLSPGEEIPDLEISLTIAEGDTLYLEFSAIARIYAPVTANRIDLYFAINGVMKVYPHLQLAAETESMLSANLEYVSNDLVAGTYNITILAYSTNINCYLKDITLFGMVLA